MATWSERSNVSGTDAGLDETTYSSSTVRSRLQSRALGHARSRSHPSGMLACACIQACTHARKNKRTHAHAHTHACTHARMSALGRSSWRCCCILMPFTTALSRCMWRPAPSTSVRARSCDPRATLASCRSDRMFDGMFDRMFEHWIEDSIMRSLECSIKSYFDCFFEWTNVLSNVVSFRRPFSNVLCPREFRRGSTFVSAMHGRTWCSV